MTWPAAYGEDIYTEADSEPDTLANLGPLRLLAGIWEGTVGADDHPVAEGTELDEHVEHYELQAIDRQTNGPQPFYGLLYHTHIVKPGEVELFHDQVGYWFWEPATHAVVFTLAIPRGQVLLAGGRAEPDATKFTVTASAGPSRTRQSSRSRHRQGRRRTRSRPTRSCRRPSTWPASQ